ncbi:MAG: DUF1538 domain-containing protein [Zetaproteobacteria bacterium]|nr:MAG: DUF1538 domain-containing protein [Zetaproteobacteria bacterium]
MGAMITFYEVIMFEFIQTFTRTLLETLHDLLPIVLILGFFQFVILRGPMARPWRILRGLAYIMLGMALFLMGLEEAIFPLGEIMAKQLTAPEFLFGPFEQIPEHVQWQYYGWVYAFALAIGFATTIAEPALIAIAMKAQKISGGAVSAWGLRLSVAAGVAIGVSIGCYRIVTGTDLWLYIIAAYIVVMVQTLFSPKKIIPLAYDSGGVTTSTVTVPLIAALGLGLASTIPGRNPMIDGFGLVAFASVFPIMTVLAYTWIAERWTSNTRETTRR